jgi:chromosome segregation ATPase
LVVEEAERTFERQRVRHRESNAARQTLRLKKYKASARALRIQVKILEDEVREKKNLEKQLKSVRADLRRLEHEKSEQEKEIATVTAEVAAMAKEKEEVCKEKEELRSENGALVARVTGLETQNKLVVDELEKANEKVQELAQIKDHLLSEHCTLNAENTNLKDELKQKDEANDYLYGALKKAEEDIVRVERSLALVVEGRDRVNRDLQASRDETREANIRASKDHERAVEAIKKVEEYEAILEELAAHEAKTSAERSSILQRMRRDHERPD